MSNPTRVRTGVCNACGETFTAGKTGRIAKRCLDCRTARPKCRGCGGEIPLVWRDGPKAGWVVGGYYCRDDCKPRCTVNGCERPLRKREWCDRHYALWFDHGDTTQSRRSPSTVPTEPREPSYKWAIKTACWTCNLDGNDASWTHPSRKFCSPNCAQLWRKHKGKAPSSIDCAVCGIEVPLLVPVGDRTRRRSDTAFCVRHARRPSGGWCMSVAELAERDGPWCHLCGFVVDMTIPHPDAMCPTVDHVTPRALGGQDIPENVALAHKSCNSRKRNKMLS